MTVVKIVYLCIERKGLHCQIKSSFVGLSGISVCPTRLMKKFEPYNLLASKSRQTKCLETTNTV